MIEHSEFIPPTDFVDVHIKAEARYGVFQACVIQTIENGKKEFPHKDFYVDIVWKTKRDESYEIEYVGVAWQACPTPHYNQTVYKYNRAVDDVEILWTLPPEQECLDMYEHRNELDASEWPLLPYVMSFYDGSLFNLVNKKEKEDGTRKFD